jgi:hypothetical protein
VEDKKREQKTRAKRKAKVSKSGVKTKKPSRTTPTQRLNKNKEEIFSTFVYGEQSERGWVYPSLKELIARFEVSEAGIYKFSTEERSTIQSQRREERNAIFVEGMAGRWAEAISGDVSYRGPLNRIRL